VEGASGREQSGWPFRRFVRRRYENFELEEVSIHMDFSGLYELFSAWLAYHFTRKV
jgi:hypothetical protein